MQIQILKKQLKCSLKEFLSIPLGRISMPQIWDIMANAKRRSIYEKNNMDALFRCEIALKKIAQLELSIKYNINIEEFFSSYQKLFTKESTEIKLLLSQKQPLNPGVEGAFQLLEKLGNHIGEKFMKNKILQNYLKEKYSFITPIGLKNCNKKTFENIFKAISEILNINEEHLIQLPKIKFNVSDS